MAVACSDAAPKLRREPIRATQPASGDNVLTSECCQPGMDWYAIRTRPKHEKIVESMLANKGYEVLLPIFKCRRRRPDRFKNILLPLFPGYLFCRFDQHARLPILTTPGVLHVVGSGRVPIPISETEVEDVRRVVNSGFEAEPWPYPEI